MNEYKKTDKKSKRGLADTATEAAPTCRGFDKWAPQTSTAEPIRRSLTMTGITYPHGSTVSFTYDVRGWRIKSTDQNQKTTYYTYDDADRLAEVSGLRVTHLL